MDEREGRRIFWRRASRLRRLGAGHKDASAVTLLVEGAPPSAWWRFMGAEDVELSAHAPARGTRWIYTRAGTHVVGSDGSTPAAVALTAYEQSLQSS